MQCSGKVELRKMPKMESAMTLRTSCVFKVTVFASLDSAIRVPSFSATAAWSFLDTRGEVAILGIVARALLRQVY